MDVLLWMAVLTVGYYLSSICIHRHWNFSSSEDLAMFDQMLWNFRHGRDLLVSLSGGKLLQFEHHFFSEHFSPILWLLALPAGVTRGPEALLIMQAFAFTLAAIPAGKLVAQLLDSKKAGLAAGLFWLSMPGMWQGVLYDFHMEAFEALFLFSFCLSFLQDKRSMWLWAVLYLACKEDTGIYLGILSMVSGFLTGRPLKGLAVMALSFAYVVVVVLWVMPVYSPTGQLLMASRLPAVDSWATFIATGKNLLFNEVKWAALLLHLVPFFGLALLGGPLFLPAAASAGLMWLSTDNRQALMQLHYPLTIYPLLFVAALGGVVWLRKHTLQIGRWKYAIVVLLLLSVISGWKIHRKNFRADLKAGQRNITEQSEKARQLLDTIPEEGSLATTLYLSPHVSRRQHLSLILFKWEKVEWIVLPLNTRNINPFNTRNLREFLDIFTGPSSQYGVWNGVPGEVVILKLNWPHDPNRDAGLVTVR